MWKNTHAGKCLSAAASLHTKGLIKGTTRPPSCFLSCGCLLWRSAPQSQEAYFPDWPTQTNALAHWQRTTFYRSSQLCVKNSPLEPGSTRFAAKCKRKNKLSFGLAKELLKLTNESRDEHTTSQTQKEREAHMQKYTYSMYFCLYIYIYIYIKVRLYNLLHGKNETRSKGRETFGEYSYSSHRELEGCLFVKILTIVLAWSCGTC